MRTTTQMCVKEDSLFLAQLRLLYLIFTSAVVGIPLTVPLYIPLALLGRIFPPAQKWADEIMVHGVAFLMKLQPWHWGSQVNIQLPEAAAHEGVLIVSNHRSHLDVFILLSQIKGIRVLAKQTLFWIPLLNVMMWVSGQIPVPQGRLDAFFAAMTRVGKKLQSGERVQVFPELTRCSLGFSGVRNFSAAPFAVAIEKKVWVLPVVFKNTDFFWPKGRFGISSGQQLIVKSLTPVHSILYSSADQLRDEVQRQITTALV